MTADPTVALVVQRYGAEIVGGSEALCRTVAEMLAVEARVEVLTTCAKDYMTWSNEYAPGESILEGISVRRFPVDFERDRRFHELSGRLMGGLPLSAYHQQRTVLQAAIRRSTRSEQLDWLRLQGPYSTPFLEFLSDNQQRYDLVGFFTYLYPTTYFGSYRVPAEKTFLVPTAHDEAPIYFPVFSEMFARFPVYIFLTPEERRFIERNFDLRGALRATIGMPVEISTPPDPERFRRLYGIRDPFILYAGRVDPSKGCDELFRYYLAGRRHLPSDLRLVLIGDRSMPIPSDERVHYLGRLPEQDKNDAMAAATIVVNPSPFESFSIVVLEAMLCGTPVLVNGDCDVLRGHAGRSSGGLYYRSPYEFVEAVRWLCGHDATRQRMARNGALYVQKNYDRDAVGDRYRTVLRQSLTRR